MRKHVSDSNLVIYTVAWTKRGEKVTRGRKHFASAADAAAYCDKVEVENGEGLSLTIIMEQEISRAELLDESFAELG